VPPGDINAFAAALQRLLADESLCRSLGEAGRRHAIEQWDRDTVLTRVAIEMDAMLREESAALAPEAAAPVVHPPALR
jgi:glycosyltransferase involved in cell wall biosynthesis